MNRHARSLIETAFPVAKLSSESYKERSAGAGQRLTGVGKWWGRKPLVLVRATLLACLIPASDDPQADVEVFERLMGMDERGLCERHPRKLLKYAAFAALSPADQLRQVALAETYGGPTDPASWERINAHLGTRAGSLQEVVEQLGVMRFGHAPRVGDVFAGGGSIPFEAARIGCEAFASDLNPVAGLLTWSNQALLCATPENRARINDAQAWVYAEVDRQITEWGIEHDDQGRRADAYLWCNEVLDPETGYVVPLAATWVIGQRSRVIAELVPDHAARRYDIRVVSGASDAQMNAAKAGTVIKQHLVPPPTPDTPAPKPSHMSRLRDRHDNGAGLRNWEPADLTPRAGDFFQERLYCVRWVDAQGKRHYESATPADTAREERALSLLRDRVAAWQDDGTLPSMKIEAGYSADQPTRARGWTCWHQLFTPRQLLTNGLFAEAVSRSEAPKELLGLVGKVAHVNAKLCIWDSSSGDVKNVFTGQSISPIYNHGTRGFQYLKSILLPTSGPAGSPDDWQARGFVPSAKVEGGYSTDQITRTRGWTHWHQLFTPRQLLTNGLFSEVASQSVAPQELLALAGRVVGHNARMTGWHWDGGAQGSVFASQSLSPLYNYSTRAFQTTPSLALPTSSLPGAGLSVRLQDARTVDTPCDLWVTDPPYADAINYEEISEFFLSWYEKRIPKLFPDWYAESKRELAVKGKGRPFNTSMIDVYSNLTRLMPDNGMQVLMFGHQDARVWAELAMTLWTSGLKVTAAWTIATEPTSGFKAETNSVEGTVLLVLRKRGREALLFEDELLPLIAGEVQAKLGQMGRLADAQFNDSDRQLASYAAALQVITGHEIEGISLRREPVTKRRSTEKSRVQLLIEQASLVCR